MENQPCKQKARAFIPKASLLLALLEHLQALRIPSVRNSCTTQNAILEICRKVPKELKFIISVQAFWMECTPHGS